MGWSEGSDEVLWCQALRHAGEEHAKQSRIDDELSAMMGELSAAQVQLVAPFLGDQGAVVEAVEHALEGLVAVLPAQQ